MAIVISFLGVGVVAIPTGIISAGFVEQYHRKSVISDWKRDDVKEISEILVDARLAGQLVEDVENEETTKVYLIVRDNLSILPRRDIELKLGDVLIMRMDNQ